MRAQGFRSSLRGQLLLVVLAALGKARPPGGALCFLDRNGTVLARHPEGRPAAGPAFSLAAILEELAGSGKGADVPSEGSGGL